MIADWYVDPIERFDGRFYDGIAWTNQVSDSGILRIDPLWPPTEAVAVVAHDGACGQEVGGQEVGGQEVGGQEAGGAEPRRGMRVPQRRGSSDRRQINTQLQGQPDRRKRERRQRAIVIPRADQYVIRRGPKR